MTADLVAAILGFFAEITREPMIKDWMGSAEGSIFWPVLLTLLCTIPVQAPRTNATSQTSSINYKHKVSCFIHSYVYIIACSSLTCNIEQTRVILKLVS